MNNFHTVYCRFCAEQKPISDIIDLNTNDRVRTETLEKLAYFPNTDVNFANSNLPQTICTICCNSLSSAYDFFTKVKLSQVILTNISMSGLKNEQGSDSNHSYSGFEIKLEVDSEEGKNKPSNESNDGYVPLFNMFEGVAEPPHEIDLSKLAWSSYPWVCRLCKMNLTSLNTLREHCKKSHGICHGFKCVDCDVEIENFDMFAEHVRGHRNDLNNFCHYCNMKFEEENLTNHANTHTSQPHCVACGEIFPNKTSLYRHISRYQQYKKDNSKKSAKQNLLALLVTYGIEIYEPDEGYMESWQQYPWVCQACNTQCTDQVLLRIHMKEAHLRCFAMKCADCDVEVDNFVSFVEHVRRHRPNLKYYCQFCNYRFEDPHQSVAHMRIHLNTQKQCEVCSEFFTNRTELYQHMVAMKRESKQDPEKPVKPKRRSRNAPVTIEDLTCKICNKVSKTLDSMRSHKKTHVPRTRDYACDRCGKTFFTKGCLNAHSVIHDNPDPQVCKICKKSFLTFTRLKKHVTTHNGERPFQCHECHKRFRLKEQLKSHMICHGDIMPYQCKFCGKQFRHKTVLQTHEVQHTGARPYNCHYCDMDFANWSNCNKHMKRKHGATLAKSVLTPQGKLPINPKTGKPKKVKDWDTVKEWTEQVMAPRKVKKDDKKIRNENVKADKDSQNDGNDKQTGNDIRKSNDIPTSNDAKSGNDSDGNGIETDDDSSTDDDSMTGDDSQTADDSQGDDSQSGDNNKIMALSFDKPSEA